MSTGEKLTFTCTCTCKCKFLCMYTCTFTTIQCIVCTFTCIHMYMYTPTLLCIAYIYTYMYCTMPMHFVWVAKHNVCLYGQDLGSMHAGTKNEEISSLSQPQGHAWHHGHALPTVMNTPTKSCPHLPIGILSN